MNLEKIIKCNGIKNEDGSICPNIDMDKLDFNFIETKEYNKETNVFTLIINFDKSKPNTLLNEFELLSEKEVIEEQRKTLEEIIDERIELSKIKEAV